jgi:hypothetical protein
MPRIKRKEPKHDTICKEIIGDKETNYRPEEMGMNYIKVTQLSFSRINRLVLDKSGNVVSRNLDNVIKVKKRRRRRRKIIVEEGVYGENEKTRAKI